MPKKLEPRIMGVTYSNGILSIDFEDIGILTGSNLFSSGGSFGEIWLRDIPLDEVINLQYKLSVVINERIKALDNGVEVQP